MSTDIMSQALKFRNEMEEDDVMSIIDETTSMEEIEDNDSESEYAWESL